MQPAAPKRHGCRRVIRGAHSFLAQSAAGCRRASQSCLWNLYSTPPSTALRESTLPSGAHSIDALASLGVPVVLFEAGPLGEPEIIGEGRSEGQIIDEATSRVSRRTACAGRMSEE